MSNSFVSIDKWKYHELETRIENNELKLAHGSYYRCGDSAKTVIQLNDGNALKRERKHGKTNYYATAKLLA